MRSSHSYTLLQHELCCQGFHQAREAPTALPAVGSYFCFQLQNEEVLKEKYFTKHTHASKATYSLVHVGFLVKAP